MLSSDNNYFYDYYHITNIYYAVVLKTCIIYIQFFFILDFICFFLCRELSLINFILIFWFYKIQRIMEKLEKEAYIHQPPFNSSRFIVLSQLIAIFLFSRWS